MGGSASNTVHKKNFWTLMSSMGKSRGSETKSIKTSRSGSSLGDFWLATAEFYSAKSQPENKQVKKFSTEQILASITWLGLLFTNPTTTSLTWAGQMMRKKRQQSVEIFANVLITLVMTFRFLGKSATSFASKMQEPTDFPCARTSTKDFDQLKSSFEETRTS